MTNNRPSSRGNLGSHEERKSQMNFARFDYVYLCSPSFKNNEFENFKQSPRNLEEVEVDQCVEEFTEIAPTTENRDQVPFVEISVKDVSTPDTEEQSNGKWNTNGTTIDTCELLRLAPNRNCSNREKQFRDKRFSFVHPRHENTAAFKGKDLQSEEATALRVLASVRKFPCEETAHLFSTAIGLELLRREGSALLKRNDPHGALHRFSICIMRGENVLLNPASSPVCWRLVRKTLKLAYSSRAQMLLGINMWDAVVRDADRALIFDSFHVKSLVSKGKALHALQLYRQACLVFATALNRYPSSIQVASALHESMKRQQQSISGNYDLGQFLLLGDAPPECSDYVGPIEIKHTSYAGRGLFVTKSQKAGDLLLVSNAFAIASTPSSAPSNELKVKLARMIMDRVRASKRWEHQVHYLTRGRPEQENLGIPDMALFVPGSDWSPDPNFKSDISILDIMRKITINTFDASWAISDDLKVTAERDQTSIRSSGVWILPSFLNHSCIPNTVIFFIGKALFLRASRDLESGEELTTSYASCSNPHRKQLIWKWNFTCRCERCKQDVLVEPYMKHLREELDGYSYRYRNKTSIKTEKLREHVESVDMVQRLERTLEVLPIQLNQQRKNWVRVSFMAVYYKSAQLAGMGGDINLKILTLQKLLEIEESIYGGGSTYEV